MTQSKLQMIQRVREESLSPMARTTPLINNAMNTTSAYGGSEGPS
jgi:hypothetical protein